MILLPDAKMKSIGLKCPITSLLYFDDEKEEYLLVGQGNSLSLLSKKNELHRLKVFTASKIHQIKEIRTSEFLVCGGKSLAVVNVTEGGRLEIKNYEKIIEDWIWDSWFDPVTEIFHFLTAHNRIIRMRANFETCDSLGCEEKCILYSGLVVPGRDRGGTVLAGSVFSKILVWTFSEDSSDTLELPVHHRLSGHEGVIFR